jgi:hypothetical protein
LAQKKKHIIDSEGIFLLIVNFRRNIQDFVPKTLLPSKRTQEWEQLILDEHEKLIGKSSEDAKSEYLQVVKGWPYYGSTFYPPCKCTSAGKSQKVIIGINYEGIRLLKPKTKV